MMKVAFEKLDNGLQVLALRDASCPFVAINLLCDITPCRAMAVNPGIYRLVVHLLKNMIEPSSGISYSRLIDQAAVESGVADTHDYIMLSQTLASTGLEQALMIESQRLLYLPEMIEPDLITQELDAIENVARRPRFMNFNRVLHNALFSQGHPYHDPAEEDIKTELNSFPVEQLQDLCRKILAPETICLCVAGNFTHRLVEELVKKYFSVLPMYQPGDDTPAFRRKETGVIGARSGIIPIASPIPNPVLCFGWRLAPGIGKRDHIINICATLPGQQVPGMSAQTAC